jgi:hypothetical protein
MISMWRVDRSDAHAVPGAGNAGSVSGSQVLGDVENGQTPRYLIHWRQAGGPTSTPTVCGVGTPYVCPTSTPTVTPTFVPKATGTPTPKPNVTFTPTALPAISPTRTPVPPPGPRVILNPNSGAPDDPFDISAVGFPAPDAGSSGLVSFGGQPYFGVQFESCADGSAGFGTACGRQAVTAAVPGDSNRNLQLVQVTDRNGVTASTPFFIQARQSTATPTLKPTLVATRIPAPTATITANPAGSVNALNDGILTDAWVSNHPRNAFAILQFAGTTTRRITSVGIDPAANNLAPVGAQLQHFQIWTSTTGTAQSNFQQVFAGTLTQDPTLQFFSFNPVAAKYVELKVVDNFGDPQMVAVAELEIVADGAGGTVVHTHAHFNDAMRSGSPSPLASIAFIDHGLTVAPPKKHKVAGKVKMSLFGKYGLQTKTKQRATIRFKDGTVLHLDELTDAVMQSPSITKVKGGTVDEKLKPGANHSIQTSAALASAIGTNWLEVVKGNTTRLFVIEGAVLVSNPFGSVVVKTGENLSVQKGQAPGTPQKTEGNPPSRWVQGMPNPALGLNVGLDANGGRVVASSS